MSMGVHKIINRFAKDEAGAAAIEFAVVVALMFFFLFAIFDFGRIALSQIMAENAVELAARTAIVRPPACTGVPDIHNRNDTTDPPARFGTSCSESGACVTPNPNPITCTLDTSNATANEIWTRIRGWVPPGTQPQHVIFSYTYDSNLGFAGGPYTPLVTVDIDAPNFQFVSPLGALARIAGAINPGLYNSFDYPLFTTTLPAEDLNLGTGG